MKKILLITLAIASVFAVKTNAQEQESFKPQAGSFSLEVGFSPLSLAGDNSSVHLPMGNLTGVYSVSDKWGVRLALGISSRKSKLDNCEKEPEKQMVSTLTQTIFSFAPGFTYSFKGTPKLAPYAGGEFMFATTANKWGLETYEYERINTNGQMMTGGDFYNASRPFNAYGVNLITGFNYYMAKNIYLGIEVGLGAQYTRLKKAEVAEIRDNITVSEKEKATDSRVGVSLYANPLLRLGWAF